MKRFKFRFDAVEKVRRNREQQVLRLLGASQRDLEAAQARKRKLTERLATALAAREKIGLQSAYPADFGISTDFIQGTKQRIIQADGAIARAKRALEKATRVYLIARRQLRAIETLREKHHEEWKRERSKKEQKELDDLVIMRSFYLKGAEG